MLAQTFAFLLETIIHLFVLAALTRFFAQAFRAPFRNPITDFIVALTDFAVKPLRRVIPGMLGMDLASFMVAWLAEIILVIALVALAGAPLGQSAFFPTVLLVALLRLIKLSVYLLIAVVIVQALLSWTNPYHPMMTFFNALSQPFLKPFRRVIPLIGGIDLSPLAMVLVCQVILMLPLALLERRALSLINLSF